MLRKKQKNHDGRKYSFKQNNIDYLTQGRRHILKDIEPYVCLFEDCSDGNTIFRSPNDWLSHMQWQHTIIWSCQVPGHEQEVYDTQAELEDHVRSAHSASFTDSQICYLLENCARPHPDTFAVLANSVRPPSNRISESTSSFCPLCHQTVEPKISLPGVAKSAEAPRTMYDHILEHLEGIALLSLPPIENTEDRHSDASSSAKVIASTAQDMHDLPPAYFDNNATQSVPSSDILVAELFDLRVPDMDPALDVWVETCRILQDRCSESLEEQSLKEQLLSARIEYPPTSHLFFVPRSDQESLITALVVADILSTKFPESAEVNKVAENTCRYARQLFAILASMKKGAEICPLLNDAISDRDLPLRRIPNDQNLFALQLQTGESIPTLEKWNQRDLEKFDRIQWWMTAPVFKYQEHHDLDDNVILPFIPFTSNAETQEPKQGGYSEVYPACVDPAHHEFWECTQSEVWNITCAV